MADEKEKEGIAEAEEENESSEPAIVVEGVKKQLGDKQVLDGVNFTVDSESITVILGSSGCGKSTLLKCMIGAIKPDEGRVLIDGKDIGALKQRQLNELRKGCGMVFQNIALFQDLTVAENVALPIREHSNLDDSIISIMVKMKLDQVGLSDFDDLLPDQLSSGMQKRVGIARALALDPKILFFDEPTAGLDPIVSAHIVKLIEDLTRLLGISSVVVTHDIESAQKMADRIIMLYAGKVFFNGTAEELISSDDPLVTQFVNGDPDGPIPMNKTLDDYEKHLLEM